MPKLTVRIAVAVDDGAQWFIHDDTSLTGHYTQIGRPARLAWIPLDIPEPREVRASGVERAE